MSTAELILPQADQYTLRVMQRPEHLVEQAKMIGKPLKAEIERNHWAVNLGGTNPHLKIEGAQFIGQIFGVSARICQGSTQCIEIGDAHGWVAEAETIHWESQTVFTRASAMCLSDEDNWSLRPKYEGRGQQRKRAVDAQGQPLFAPTPQFQLRSMAETRACSKAYRLLFAWIYTMHGFESAGAEEMSDDNRIRQPQARATAGNKITDAQAKRLWAIGLGKKPQDDIIAIIKQYGFASSGDITRDKYDEIIAELEKSDAAE